MKPMGLCLLLGFLLFFYPALAAGKAPEEQQLYAQAAVLLDGDSGRVLYSKNGEEKLPMASTTKIMTCILVLEAGDLDALCPVSAYAASMPKVRMGVREGEQYRRRDLLYAMMLESYNDAAVVLAESLAGSVEAFAERMNQKAWDLGCLDTYFITPNGLDAAGEKGVHSTTARDLAVILAYCVQNQEFLEITQTASYSFTDAGGSRSFSCANHNAFLTMMDGALSGKTGFTNNAGYCYAGALRRDGRTFVVALLGCGWPNNRDYKWADTRRLMEYGLEEYQYRQVWQEPNLSPIRVEEGIPEDGDLTRQALTPAEIPASVSRSLRLLLREDETVEWEVQQAQVLTAPVASGEVVGKLVCRLNGETVAEFPITAKEQVRRLSGAWCFNQVWERFLLGASSGVRAGEIS